MLQTTKLISYKFEDYFLLACDACFLKNSFGSCCSFFVLIFVRCIDNFSDSRLNYNLSTFITWKQSNIYGAVLNICCVLVHDGIHFSMTNWNMVIFNLLLIFKMSFINGFYWTCLGIQWRWKHWFAFKVLTAVTQDYCHLGYETLWSGIHECFRRTSCFHLQGAIISHARENTAVHV